MKTLLILYTLCTTVVLQGAVFTSELVTNLPPAVGTTLSSSPSNGVTMGSFIYFAAADGPYGGSGRELWRTDGTSNGTTLVKDIRPGSGDSSPELLTVAGTNVFFVADDGVNGRELWKSDGTAAGTMLVTNLTANGSSEILSLKAAGRVVYFTMPFLTNFTTTQNPNCIFQVTLERRRGQLLKSDGTAAGTVRLAGPGGLLTTNGILLSQDGLDTPQFGGNCSRTENLYDLVHTYSTNAVFSEYVGTTNYQSNVIWRTDGSVAGSVRLVTTNAFISDFRALEPDLYYVQQGNLLRRSVNVGGSTLKVNGTGSAYIEGTNNGRLYFTDIHASCNGLFCLYSNALASVTSGQSAVVITYQTINGSFRYRMIGAGGGLVYYHPSDPLKIFQTTGTSTGALAVDFESLGITPSQFSFVGPRLFFTTKGTNAGLEIGVSDFTPASTRILTDLYPGTNDSNPVLLGAFATNLIFGADDGLLGAELWRANGTNSVTLVKEIATGTDSPPPTEVVAVGSTLFLSVDSPGVGQELWKSDGTPAGTTLIKDIRFGPLGSNPTNLTAWDGLLYFNANDGTNGMELWRSDGTASGTYLVKNIRGGASSSNPSQLTAADNFLFFVADDGSHGVELWRTDGTDTGTILAQDIVPGIEPGGISNLSSVGSLIYFLADTGGSGREPWFSDGQPGGTQFLKNLATGTNSSSLSRAVSLGGTAYFLSGAGASYGLWRTDGTPEGTTLLQSGSFSNIGVAGGNVFISDATGLWRSTGGALTLLKDFSPTPISPFVTVGTQIYFSVAEDLWTSDGTTNGTVLAADFPIPPVDPAPFPAHLTPFSGALLFTSLQGVFGREFWATAPGQTATLVADVEAGPAASPIRHVSAASDKVFFIARQAGQPAWQVHAMRLQSLAPLPRAPRTGSPFAIPGRLEAEDFDLGGEGFAFHDTGIVNEGGQYRVTEGVDIETCTDTNGGFCITRTRNSEWLEYTFSAALSGIYRIDLRVAAAAAGASLHLGIDGVLRGSNAVPNTGSANNWTNLSIPGVLISTGLHVLRISFDNTNSAGDSGRINFANFVLVASNDVPTVSILDPTYGDFFSPGDGVLLRAIVFDSVSASPPVVEFFIDGLSVGVDTNSPYQGSWIATPGAHLVRAVATDSFGASGSSLSRLFFVADSSIPFGSEWRFDERNSYDDEAWQFPNFDDSRWSMGPGELGFGDGDEVTTIRGGTSASPRVTVYFRHTFILTNAHELTYAHARLFRDDAAIAYLNGVEVGRFNLPKFPISISYTNRALTNINNNIFGSEGALDSFTIPGGLLTNGSNVLAVELHQSMITLDPEFDLSFDFAFSMFAYQPGAVLRIATAGTNAIVRWPAYLENWRLEETPDFVTWTPVPGGYQLENDFAKVTLPMGTQAFYRLRQQPPAP